MKVATRASLSLVAVLCLLVPAACAPVRGVVIETRRPEPIYEQLYPYYVEVCALSQIRPIGAAAGGSAGHAVMYLKGVCRQEDAPFPLLEICEDDSTDINDAESGVGVSVNKMFKNVNWVAIPGKRLFLYGYLSPYQRLTRGYLEVVVREAVELGIFRGVEVHEEYLESKPADLPTEEFIAQESVATDYALKFGRSIFCGRLPVTIPMLGEIVAFLNALNREYASGKADYNWSGYHDNCAHTIHNSLASGSVWAPKSVNNLKLFQLFNLAIPANEFANLAVLANEYPIDNVALLYQDEVMRKSLLEYGWLPTRHGALLKTIGVQQDNDLYDTGFKLFVLEGPLFKPKSQRLRRMLSESHYLEIENNLLHFKAKYEAILKARPTNQERRSQDDTFAKTARRYYEYIAQQFEDVEEKLSRLSELRNE